MAAGDINDAATNIPNVVLVDQSSASAAPGVGYARLEVVDGVLGVRVGDGAWTPIDAGLDGPTLHALTEKATPVNADELLLADSAASWAAKRVLVSSLPAPASLATSYIGRNSVGESWADCTYWHMHATQVTLAADALLLSVQGYVKGSPPGYCGIGAAVYTDASGAPGYLLAASLTHQLGLSAISADGRWLASPLGVLLPAGTYWLGFQSYGYSADDMQLAYTSGSGEPKFNYDQHGIAGDNQAWTAGDGLYSIRGLVLA